MNETECNELLMTQTRHPQKVYRSIIPNICPPRQRCPKKPAGMNYAS